MYNACIASPQPPICLYDWCVLAEEVDIDQNRNKYHGVKAWKTSTPLERKKEIARNQATTFCSLLQAWKRRPLGSRVPSKLCHQERESNSERKSSKDTTPAKEKTLKGSEDMEFIPSPN